MRSLRKIILDGNPLRRIRRSLIVGPTEELKRYLRTRGDPYVAGGEAAAALATAHGVPAVLDGGYGFDGEERVGKEGACLVRVTSSWY